MQFFEDGVGRGGPAKGLAVRVVGGDETIDALNQLFDAGERTAADSLVGDQGKEAFDLIQPRAVGGDKVHVPAGPSGQPSLDLRMAGRRVVVHDAVDVEFGRHGFVYLAQEGQEFLMSVARLASGHSRAIEHVQRGKQRRRAMALVVVGNAFDVAEAHRQHGLRALQRLARTLLVDANDQCVLRRAQI